MPLSSTNGRSPGLLGELKIRQLLERALARSEADETEAVLSVLDESLTRFAHNVIHQNVAEADAGLEIRAAFGRRVGMATTNDLSAAGIERAVAQACAVARHMPENPDWPGLPGARDIHPAPPAAFDDRVAGLCGDPEARARAVGDICAAARAADLYASGAFSTERAEYAVMNSKGLFAYAPSTEVDLAFVMEARDGTASSYAHGSGWRLSQIDTEGLKAGTVERALAGRQPRRVPGGEYPVVLEPYAVLDILEALVEDGMGALAVQEGRSWMTGRFGQRCLSASISIVDDAYDPEGCPQAFDCEGVPKRRVSIMENGVPISPVYDRLTAAREAGRSSTGHAQPYDEDWDGPLPENLSLVPGDLSVEEMIRTVDRGLYVTRFWYVNQTAPHDGGITGTTRDGVWWIERGELAYPVATLRIDQELIDALGRVRGVGRERRTLAGYYGKHRVPALSLESFRFVAP